MQKFFSLVCAVLLVFSASAAPVAQTAQLIKKAPVAVEQMQKVQFEKAQTLNLNQLSATPALTVSNQKAQTVRGNQMLKKAQAPARRSAANARKVVNAPLNTNITIGTFSPATYEGEYYVTLTDAASSTQFIFDIDISANPFELGKTYTIADMVEGYTGIGDAEDWYAWTSVTAATYTETVDEKGLTHVVASMTDEDGNVYDITYDEKAFEPSGVQIPLNGTELSGSYNSWYYMYVYTAKVGDNEIQLAFDATAEQETYTKDQLITDYCVYYSPDYSTYVEFVKAASDFTVTTTEKTKTLAGSVYAENGDEYVLNLVYEKPDAKEITLEADTLDFFTKMLNAGYYTVSGYNVDSTYEFSFYFISKSIAGNFTAEDMDAYSTWVDQKDGKKTVVSYQNLSAANVTVSFANDTLYYTGTMTLATYDGQEANITLNLSCPYEQTWGEWADFAPFDLNTGKYSFSALDYSYTQRNIAVQYRTDNMGLKQYKLAKWGDGMFADPGTGKVDLVITMDGKYNCTITPTITDNSSFAITDYTTYTGQTDVASTYDPETATFKLAAVYFNPSTFNYYAAGYETFVMDKPITERDTVDIVSTALKYNNLIATNKVVIFYAADVPNYYLFRVTSNATTVDGTFKWAEGGINNFNSYFSVTGSDKNYFQDGEFTVVTEGKNIALNGWMIGEDEKYYRLNMSYTAPTERDTLRFSGKGVTISECTNSQTGVQTGWFYQLADASTGYEFLLQSTVVAEIYSTFSYADKTLGSNYYNVFDPQGNRQQFVEGSITVSNDGSEIVLDGELIAEDEKVYVLHFTQSASVLNYDTDAPFDATFAYSDMSASIEDGVIGIYATNAENLTIGLELYADPAATTIPAGTYTISDTQEAGTALKSLGVAGGYLTECWAGVRGTSGITDCWFMVEGAVTIAEDGSIAVNAKNSYGQDVIINIQAPTPTVTDYYLVGWINGAAYGIEGDIDNFGDYHFVDGKVAATFNELSYVQVKDNNKQIYGSAAYVAPVDRGEATLLASGTEKVAINGGVEMEYTLVVNSDGTLTLSYAPVATGLNDINAAVKATKVVRNGRMMVIKDAKVYSVLGQQIQ